MNRRNVGAIALTVSLAVTAGVMAQSLTQGDYTASKDSIAAEYKSAIAACAALDGNAKDICVAEAVGVEKVASAELEASYAPNSKTHYEARVAKAEADYRVAKERCDDVVSHLQHLCVKEAKAAWITTEADAKAQMKTADANATAIEKSADARSNANSEAAKARMDATAAKLDAQYTVGKENCQLQAGVAKEDCLVQAKAQAGK